MSMILYDTIAAISTPIGSGGIAIVRLSGRDAESIAQRVTMTKSGKSVSELEARRLTLCSLFRTDDKKALIDEALIAVMRAPNSYTGETVVEFNCHGGFFAASVLLDELIKAGARLAEAGEFTRRAFINGKTDLMRAEAAIDLINSNSKLGMSNAAKQLRGDLSEKIDALRAEILSLASHVSAATDYPEEVEPPEKDELTAKISDIIHEMDKLIDSFETGRLLRDGILTAIVGRPNVGKSSVLNALARADRAIVTDIPGTTRDVIEEYINIRGRALRLLDTAGIREGADEVEKIGIERAKDNLKQADLRLFVIDSSEGVSVDDIYIAHELHGLSTIVLLNKTDKDAKTTKAECAEKLGIDSEFIIETATPKDGVPVGIDKVENTIEKMFESASLSEDSACITSERQRDSLMRAKSSMSHALETAQNEMPFDLLYIDLEDAISALGEVTGQTVSEEIIDEVFSRFCVGK